MTGRLLTLGVGALLWSLVAGCEAPSQRPQATPTTPNAGLPNPASVYCEEHGGRVEIRKAADGSEYGVCVFADGSECDEWAYFHKECQPGQGQVTPPAPRPEEAETQPVEGWVGVVVKAAPGDQIGDRFEREDGEVYTIGAEDEAVRAELESIRGTGDKVKVWGKLYYGVPADQARHVVAERLELVDQ
ncbi:MAG: putative hemolysin [Anaerolineae bacterium]